MLSPQLFGRIAVMPGRTNISPAKAAMPPAVLRTSAPRLTPNRPVTVRNSAAPTTARSTCGLESVVCTWWLRRIGCDTRNAVNDATSMSTNVIAA